MIALPTTLGEGQLSGGIFLAEGMTFGISDMAFGFDSAGEPSMRIKLTLSYDACIAWAKIALTHREGALRSLEERRAAWSNESRDDESNEQRGRSLVAEFQSSIQAVVAAATCIDALYDHITRMNLIQPETRRAWIRKRRPRYVQVSETLRVAFNIKPSIFNAFKENLKAIYVLIDYSVHPSSKPEPPYPHPEIDILTSWSLAAFRGDVADMFVCSALGLLWETGQRSKHKSAELSDFMSGFKARVQEILPTGPLLPQSPQVRFTLPPRG